VSVNPYQPPGAAVADVPTPAEAVPPRPRAAMFTMIIGWIVLAFTVVTLVRFTYFLVVYWSQLTARDTLIVSVVLRAALAAYVFLMLIAIQKRSKFGRWSGALFIGSALVVPFTATSSVPNGNTPELVGYYLGMLIVTAPILYWLYAFAFSRKARTWFNWVPGADAPR